MRSAVTNPTNCGFTHSSPITAFPHRRSETFRETFFKSCPASTRAWANTLSPLHAGHSNASPANSTEGFAPSTQCESVDAQNRRNAASRPEAEQRVRNDKIKANAIFLMAWTINENLRQSLKINPQRYSFFLFPQWDTHLSSSSPRETHLSDDFSLSGSSADIIFGLMGNICISEL